VSPGPPYAPMFASVGVSGPLDFGEFAIDAWSVGCFLRHSLPSQRFTAPLGGAGRAFLPPQPRGGISGIQQVPLGDSQGELAAGAGWPKGVAVRGGSGRPLQGGATPPWATLLPAWGLSSPHSSNARGIHKSRWLRNGWDSTWVASSQKPSPCLVD
jgi:hypothetical protein